MKKFIAGVFATSILSAGLVAVSGSPAVAEHCYGDSTAKTATSAVGVEPNRPHVAKVFIQVTSFREGTRKGDLSITLVKKNGRRAGESWGFERRYNSNKSPSGRTYKFSPLPRGRYAALVSFIPDGHCKFKPSAGNAKRVRVLGG